MWYAYILQCNDNSLYTGISTDIQERLKVHNSGKGSKYTRSHRPVELVYQEKCGNRAQALRREIEIKSLSPKNKRKLVELRVGWKFPPAPAL